MENLASNIIQIEGKDILNCGVKGLKIKDNKKKFKATIDYSLECIQLDKVAKAVYKDQPKKQNIFYMINGKQYTDAVISVTFKYAVKEFSEKYIKKDKINKYFVKYEEIDNIELEKIEFDENGEYHNDKGELVAFKASKDTKDIDKLCGSTLKSAKDIRENLYENGFKFNGNKMVRFMRSSGSSRVGKCLFIREDLYNDIIKWSMMGLTFAKDEKINLAGLEAYIALITSSIIDTIHIDPKNILLIKDEESTFNDTAIVTEMENINNKDRLVTKEKPVEITNKIWDGQSLLDSSVFKQWKHANRDLKDLIKPVHFKCNTKIDMKKYNKNNYSDKGFLLLRNRMTKTACFNTNIQGFFKDNNITSLEQLNYIGTGAEKIEDILMITTPSSIKYLKFNDNFMDYIKELESTWGVVKYDKPTHYFDGEMVQCHYQLLNTLNMDKTAIQNFLQPSFDYLKLLKTDINVFRQHLKMKLGDTLEERELNNTNDLMFSLLEVNNDVEKTNIFQNFRDDAIDSYIKNMRKGHILVRGNYSVLFGNGLEMLKATIKDEKHPMHWNRESSVLVGNEIHNTNFTNEELLGCRSPHVTMGNRILFKNVECKVLNKYFNLTAQIVCVNSIKENLLERASSADFDSDQLILTNNCYLLSAMKKDYDKFLVPTSKVEADPVKRLNTAKEKSKLDFDTSENLIGWIINTSQQLNSKLWHMINKDKKAIDSPEVQELYRIVCQLDVMSCIEIDKAKKEFTINNKLELQEICKRYLDYELVHKNTYKIASDRIISSHDKFIEFQINKNTCQDCKNLGIDYKKYREDYKNQLLDYREKLKDYKIAKVRPMFFKYIAKKENKKQKYYYETYETTMDILEEVITEKIPEIRTKRNSNNNLKQLIQVMDDIKYAGADRKQIPVIIKKVEDHNNDCKAIWAKDMIESEEKYTKCKKKQNEIAEYYRDNIKKETMYKIIYELCHTSDYDHIARKLITILFKSCSKVFLEMFNDKKEDLSILKRLYREPQKGEKIIKIYDMNYIITKKVPHIVPTNGMVV
ncbi:hypothetical protein [Clostridium scatologenes]|uniref:Uncharacterized protein n=1 Tax=Clostridium scatologenes TaxID=1548 RepID=A0A0E3K1M1_CLOSL|nr:hypothetical protein [Clostridium scatologenes]AKA70162.1 hypothetical protein CSCA_3037 [Clostridium scatologenes]